MQLPISAYLEYPESDGKPMGETEWHIDATMNLLATLREHFRQRPEVHVGSNLFIYYQKGDPTQVVCPDLFVAFGARPGARRVWKTWEEDGIFPQTIVELTSPSTRMNDIGDKRGRYEVLGVQEYFVYDPLGDTVDPRLRGWRRTGTDLAPIRAEPSIPARRLMSESLGLFLEEDGYCLRPIETRSGARLRFPHEEAEARRQEAEGRRQEAEARARAEARAHAAESEVAQLKAEIDRLRGRKRRPR
jgi:Uma2 family endonuclease